MPRAGIHILLDNDHDDLLVEEEVNISVTRMAGGVTLSQALSCFTLLFPMLIQDISRTIPRPISVITGRMSIAIQSTTGLLWVIGGLLDDRGNEASDVRQRKTFGPLLLGFFILIISCCALMLSFWPVNADPRWPLTTTNDGNSAASDASSNTNPYAEPLLASSHNEGNQPANLRQQGEVAAYRLLEDAPEPSDVEEGDDHVEETQEQENGFEGSLDQPTSRIRGTRRLLKLAAPQVMYLYIGCITLLVRLPFSLSIPHFVSTTLGALSQGEFDRARREIFWLFLLGTIDACLDFWCIFWFGYANLRIVRGVRIDTFASILRQEIGFFDKHTSGELASRLNSDCGAMASDLTWFFRFSIESVVRITGITAYMLIRSPKLGAYALSIIPVVAIVNKYYGTWLSQNARKVQDALAEANSVAQESFSCIRTVIAFASERFECNKYVDKIEEQYRLNVRQTYITGLYYMFISTFLINTVVQGTLLFVGTYMIQCGKLTGEVLLAFMLYQGQLQNEMMNLFNSYSSLIKSSGAGDKVFAILDRSPPSPATGSGAVQNCEGRVLETTDGGGLSIQLRNVGFAYPSRQEHEVLKGLNLTIGQGKTVALVGPSGCGKSTIVGLLQRFYDPTHGQILLNDVDVQTLDIKAHRQRIGVVTQDPTLFSGTILSNIMYGVTEATKEQAIEAAKSANAHAFICSFPDGYETEVGERGVQLSGGQKQRIAISRAIIRKPSLLLLDEATSALDTDSEEIVQAALDSLLSNNKGITTVIVAHRLRTVRNADAIAVIKQGQIVELGPHEDLMKLPHGYYKGMVEKSLGGKLVDF